MLHILYTGMSFGSKVHSLVLINYKHNPRPISREAPEHQNIYFVQMPCKLSNLSSLMCFTCTPCYGHFVVLRLQSPQSLNNEEYI